MRLDAVTRVHDTQTMSNTSPASEILRPMPEPHDRAHRWDAHNQCYWRVDKIEDERSMREYAARNQRERDE